MSQYQAIHRMAALVGRDIAASDSKTQADLFNGFAEMFRTTMTSRLDREMQMAYIVTDLTPAAREFITHIASMVEASS